MRRMHESLTSVQIPTRLTLHSTGTRNKKRTVARVCISYICRRDGALTAPAGAVTGIVGIGASRLEALDCEPPHHRLSQVAEQSTLTLTRQACTASRDTATIFGISKLIQ